MTDKALTVAEQQAVAVAEQKLAALVAADPNLLKMWGGENLEQGDTAQPARLKLAHRKDPDIGVEEGQFFNTLTGKGYGKTLEIIPVLPLVSTRVEYFTPYTKDEPPLCASDDGEQPRQASPQRPLTDRKDGPCSTCPQAQWTDGDNDERVKPLCTRQRNFMLVLPETQEYVSFTMQKSAIPTAKQLTAMMKGAGIRKSFMLSALFVQDDYDYYMPAVSEGRRLRADELLAVIEVRAEIKDLMGQDAIRVYADETVDFDDGSEPSGPSQPEEDPIPFGDETEPLF